MFISLRLLDSKFLPPIDPPFRDRGGEWLGHTISDLLYVGGWYVLSCAVLTPGRNLQESSKPLSTSPSKLIQLRQLPTLKSHSTTLYFQLSNLKSLSFPSPLRYVLSRLDTFF